MQREDLDGNKYGKLTVLEMLYHHHRTNTNPQGRTYCRCKCDCGREIIAPAYKIKNGKKQSCGCDSSERRSKAYRKDLTGKKFGRLSVIETVFGSKVKCRCECGNVIYVSTADLISGHTQSCGCLQKERASCSSTKDFSGTVSNYGIKFLCQYSKNQNSQWLWECECGLCGNHFVALPAKILNGHITSCGCRKQSSREQLIEKILKREHIEYQRQYTIPACKNKQVLLFDFAIFNENDLVALIEYDGRQHFMAVSLYGGEEHLKLTQYRDEIKNRFCEQNNIALHRLPYAMTDAEIEQKIMSIIYP